MNESSDIVVLRNAVLLEQSRSLRRLPPVALPLPPAAVPGKAVPRSSGRSNAGPGPAAPIEPEADHGAAFASGREAGRRAGFAEGMQEAQQRLDEALATLRAKSELDAEQAQRRTREEHEAALRRLQSIALAFAGAASERLQTLEADAVELAFEAVCKIAVDPARTPGRVEGAVRSAMAALHGAKLLRVRVHPGDLALLGDGSSVVRELDGVEWIADAGVDSGGCMLDADRGSIDARLATQLDRLRKQWAGALQAATALPHLSRAA